MTLRLLLSKKDPLQSDFLDSNKVLYTSNTIYHGRFHGQRATTTVTRRDSFGNITQAGTIEWPATPNDRPRVLIRTRMVEMIKTGLYTSLVWTCISIYRPNHSFLARRNSRLVTVICMSGRSATIDPRCLSHLLCLQGHHRSLA